MIGLFETSMHIPHKNPLSEINTADIFYDTCSRFDGSKQHIFHVNLIQLLDKVFLNNCYDNLSREQQAFIEKYAAQAGTATDRLNNNSTSNTFRQQMKDEFQELDNFLGDYVGENDGKYHK